MWDPDSSTPRRSPTWERWGTGSRAADHRRGSEVAKAGRGRLPGGGGVARLGAMARPLEGSELESEFLLRALVYVFS